MKLLKLCKRYIGVVANVVLVLVMGFFLVALLGKPGTGEANIGSFETKPFNENWSIRKDDTYQKITLPALWGIEEPTTVILENTLPKDAGKGMCFSMRTAMHDYEFYIDGELREAYRKEELHFVDKHLASAYVIIELRDSDAGKSIRIQVEAEEEVRINEARLGYGNNIWFGIIRENLPVVFAACVLILCGVLAFLFAFVLKKRLHANSTVLYLGQVMVITGCWILSESKIRQLIFNNPSYSAVLSFLLIEVIAGFVAMYFNEIQKERYNTIYVIYEAGVIIQAAVNIGLAAGGLMPFRDTLILSHIWLLIGGVIFTGTCYKDARAKRIKDYSIIVAGMVLFVVFCIAEAVNYYVSEFPVLGMHLCAGLIILLVATIVQTINDEISKVKQVVELERAKEAAERTSQAKSQFLARVSHEIRTPVNAVIGLNEMILRESSETGILQYAADVKRVSTTLLDIINELLDASKIESGTLELIETEYELGNLLNDLYHLSKGRMGEKKIVLEFEVDAAVPKAYFGDDRKIQQILMNLLTNAIKYTDEGAIVLSVDCRAEAEVAQLRFSVKDTGMGIRPEDIKKLKGEFQRVDIWRNRNVEGTGLGLNIVQRYLTLMGSELQIESEYGKGSEFSFEVSQKIVNKTPLGELEQWRQTGESETNYSVKYQAPDARILVVDDHEMNLKVFRNLLKQTKMQITEAQSGKQCLELLEQQRFDLVFLDHRMPGMDGIETLHAIKERGLCVGVPIIMLTANALIGDREKYLQEGFDDFLSKPILPDKLDKMILRHIPTSLLSEYQAFCIPQTDSVSCAGNEMLKEILRRLPELDYASAIQLCGGEEDFFLEMLQMFVGLSVKQELEEARKTADYNNYCIRVHAFKNNAYSIGAKRLGDTAFEMEKLTQKGFPENIEEIQRDLFEQYDRICIRYNEAKEFVQKK